MSEQLANSIDDRLNELTLDMLDLTSDRRSTDPVTYSLGVNYMLKHALLDVRSLIADADVDGRFRKGNRRS